MGIAVGSVNCFTPTAHEEIISTADWNVNKLHICRSHQVRGIQCLRCSKGNDSYDELLDWSVWRTQSFRGLEMAISISAPAFTASERNQSVSYYSGRGVVHKHSPSASLIFADFSTLLLPDPISSYKALRPTRYVRSTILLVLHANHHPVPPHVFFSSFLSLWTPVSYKLLLG